MNGSSMEGTKVFVEQERVAGEEWIQPESPESPLIWVKEKREGIGCQAIFALELSGVTFQEDRSVTAEGAGSSLYPDGSLYLGSLLEGMSAGQSLQFVYRSGWGDRGRRSFAWKIFGQACGDSRRAATEGAQRLRRELEVFLEAIAGSYRFKPDLSPEQFMEQSGRLRGVILPQGIAVSGGHPGSIGFGAPSRGKEAVVFVPYPVRQPSWYFDAAVAGAAGCRFPVQVEVALQRVGLSERAAQTMAAALGRLRTGAADHIRYYREGSGRPVDDPELLEAVRSQLEEWIRRENGFRVECRVFSEQEVPASWLAMLGCELFHGRPVDVIAVTPDGFPAGSGDTDLGSPLEVDLRDGFPLTSAPPPLLPSPGALAEAGVKRCYPSGCLRLPEEGLLLGRLSMGRTVQDVRIPEADRSRHCYIVGATGTGKSTLLYHMILQDIERDKGVCLIDPHGDLYRRVLEAVPARRFKDLVLVDPCDYEFPVGLNFLECRGPHKQIQMNFLVNEMITIFDRLYDLSRTGGPIFEQYMRNAMLLVVDSAREGGTLLDVVQVFEDEDFREHLKSKCNNALVKRFWKFQAERATGEMSLKSMMPYVTSKLNQFTTNELLRPIVGQSRSTIDFRESIDKGRLILVNLAKGLLGELDIQLLGMLIIGKLFSAAMGRVSLSEQRRRPMYLYVDEFQNFTTDTVAHLLAEARKYGLYLTLANQNLGQLAQMGGQQGILDAVLGNVGSALVFRLGPFDAQLMQTYCRPFLTAQDLQELPDYHAAARLLVHNAPIRPFVFQTFPMCSKVGSGVIQRAVQASRRKYTRPRKEVEYAIVERRLFDVGGREESE